MDYDDNDAQDQNLHLAGEGSSKVSSVLNPYTLPKFDFDDNLQGQLRFDSLVENEVFLGIASQEDNQWIEEYSRGTSAIQFSSSVAESRHKNVWSEATSSESVEMLLKSVGHEERVAEETVIEELVARDMPGSLTNVMDPDLKQCDGTDDHINTHNTIVPEEFRENFDVSKVSTFTSQSQETSISGGELDSVVIGNNYSLSLSKKKVDKICDDISQKEVSNLANKCFVNDLQEDAYVSKIECEKEGSSLNADASVDEGQENPQEVPERCNAHLCSAERSHSSKSAVSASLICSKIDEEHNDDMHWEFHAVSPNGGFVEMKAIEDAYKQSDVPDSLNSDVGSLSSPSHGQNNSFVEAENGVGIDGQQVTSGASMVALGNNQFELGEESDINNVGKTSIAAGSSAEVPAEDISNKDEAAGNNAPKVHKRDSNDEDQSLPAKISDLVQVGDEIQSSEPDAISMDEDITFNERGARLPLDFRDTDMDVVGALDSQKNVEPSSSLEGCKGVIAMAQGSESNMDVVTHAVAAGESSKISSPDTLESGQLLSVTEDQPKSPILGVSLLHDENEEKAIGLSSEESSRKRIPEVDNTVDCALDGPLPVVERDAVSDGAEEVVQRLDGHCDPPVGNGNGNPSEQTTEDNHGGLKCSKTLETISLPCDSSADGGNDAEAGGLLDHKESMPGDGVEPLNSAVNMSDEQQASVDVVGPCEHGADHVVHNEGGSTSLDMPQSFSLLGTNSVQLSQSAKDMHEITKNSRYEDAPLSKVSNDGEGLQSVSSNSATKEEKSFSFDVSASAGSGQSGIQNISLSKNMKASSVSSSGSLSDPNKLHRDSLASPQTPSSAAIEGAKGISERKPRRKSVGKETVKKGNGLKETTPGKRSGQVEKSPELLNPPATRHVDPLEELKPNEGVECSNSKPGDIPSIPTSNLLDLNSSSSKFQQPFTDNQQLQLRAQILVYGSLISGMPPEEPHLIAAFGQSDGGRRAWEAAWHACLERVRVRKSQANNADTPMQSRSGTYSSLKDVGSRDPDQGVKIGSSGSKVLSPLPPGPNIIGISSVVVGPVIPISSPLWNIPTPCDGLQSSAMPRSALLDHRQTISSLHPFQTPLVQNLSGHNLSRLSQSPLAPFSGQRVASSPITAFSARLSALPVTEAVKLTTVKESSAGPSVSSGQPSSDLKSRKRKKVAASVPVSETLVPSQGQVASLSAPVAHLVHHAEGYDQISVLAQNQTNSVTVPVVSSHSPTSAALSTPVSITSKSNPGSFLSPISPASTHGHPRFSDPNMEKIVAQDEIVSKIEESKLQAADAAGHASAAVSHCQDVWSQLEKQKISGLVSDDESKLVSSAVSIAAAASVAKVAAAAAKIASNVAEQARLMADEVFLSNRTVNATPASILNSADRCSNPASIISAAREAARQRIEAASAASKHAENLDAIVKAAELAAEAVSQAGKIVSMGNPLFLKDLIEAGPEGYWKTPESSNQQNVEAAASDKDIQTSKHGLPLQEDSRNLAKNQMILDSNSGSIPSSENDKGEASACKGSDVSKTVGIFPESEFGSIHTSDVDPNMPQSTSHTWEENIIKEGCLVEVFKDDNKNKGAWFTANVLTVTDGKAFICYTEIQSDEGTEHVKEWVPLEVEGSEAPRIRIAHPMTNMWSEQSRKRSRTTMTDYAWCSGDRVDVRVQDSWREAIVVETNKIDVTSLTVQFPAQGETSTVRSWHVRPTLIWKDGKWIEWSGFKESCSEGDTPQEKRLKLGSPIAEGKENDKSSNGVDLVESGMHQESRILPLSGNGSSFDVGKSSRDENKPDTHKMGRSNLQKDRPRVVFGVPKPGKKQKFMDVSKHYVADGVKRNNPQIASVKHASFSMPEASRPRGSKPDTKEKQVAEIKSKVLKSRKPPVPLVRTLAQKDKSKSSKPTSDSVGIDENVSGQSRMELGSSSNTEDAIEGASVSALPSGTPKGTLTSKAISQSLNKGKVSGGDEKATKAEVKDKSTSEVEPRRSNRKIQPTSRLLEGLQSSLTISKIPTVSNASQRSHKKVTPRGNTKPNRDKL